MSVRGVFESAGLTPRPGQLEVAERLSELLSSGCNAALVAPTGWGKTLAVLAALKACNLLPALWLVRSLTLGGRVGDDAALLGLTAFTAAGRARACPLYGDMGEDVYDYCRHYKYRCRFFMRLDVKRLPRAAASYEDLPSDTCRYYAQELYLRDADVIVQSYFRRRATAKVTVIDEFHNLLQPVERRVRIGRLAEAVAELQRSGFSGEAEGLEKLLNYVVNTASETLDPQLFLDLEGLWAAYCELLKEGRRTRVGSVVRVLSSDAVYVEPPYLVGARAVRLRLRRPTALLTATAPFDPTLIPGVDACIRVPSGRRLRALLLTWLTTRYGEETWSEYERLLLFLRGYRTLAFASYRVLQRLRHRAQLTEDELVVAPREWSGVLLLKARGRFAEGVDMPADIVAMLGAPFLTPDVIQKLAKAYSRMGVENSLKLAMDAPMLITTLQCVGRAARSPEARPLVILADERYRRYLEELGEYFEIEEVDGVERLKAILAELKPASTRT